MDITSCPGCGAPAEITDRCALDSTSGPVEHVRVRCANRHWFLLSVATLARAHRGPAGPRTATRSPACDRGNRPAPGRGRAT
jgi:hypothetical protein